MDRNGQSLKRIPAPRENVCFPPAGVCIIAGFPFQTPRLSPDAGMQLANGLGNG